MNLELLASRFLLQNACRHGWGYRRLAAGLRLVGAGILTIMLLFPASLQAGGPTDQVRATVDKVLVIVRNANPKSPSQKKDLHAQKVSLNYQLDSIDKEWRVYDLVINDISVVNNYRSQYNRMIARSSFEELLRMLKEKKSVG